jgi:ABC-2 type transport system permease protein
MNDALTLLRPRIWPFLHSAASKKTFAGVTKPAILMAAGTAFWLGIFAISLRVLTYFKGIEDIGDILGYKLLSMILIISMALLLFSGILTALTKLYLSRDLPLVHSLPVPIQTIFISRWLDSTIDSSWMVVIYTLPVFICYGIVYHGGMFYYTAVLICIGALAVIASSVSTMVVMAAVIVIPANRMKSVCIFLGILFFVVLYVAIRLVKPELLVDPEVFDSVMVYISSLQTPDSPFLPSTWACDGLKAALTGSIRSSLFHMTLTCSFGAALVPAMVLLAERMYFTGFSKTQTSSPRLFKARRTDHAWLNFLPGPIKSFTVKEIKTFLRDQAQWSQLFLIAALVVIYIYNFKVLPLEKSPIKTVYLQNLFSFLNMGLALFVLTAVAARFAYPAVSQEREAFWLVKTSPLSLGAFLWIKFFVYYLPLLVLTELLVVVTNILLKVTPFMMVLSTATTFFAVPAIVAMGIGLGAAYPDFKAENPTQTVTSFGGLMFMILCAGYIALIVVLESGPVYHLFMADMRGRALTPLR